MGQESRTDPAGSGQASIRVRAETEAPDVTSLLVACSAIACSVTPGLGDAG
jgi:hypothetical protein